MGPFLTGEDEYSPDLNKNRLQEADLSTVLEALYEVIGVSTTRKLLATLSSLVTIIHQVHIHLFVGDKAV